MKTKQIFLLIIIMVILLPIAFSAASLNLTSVSNSPIPVVAGQKLAISSTFINLEEDAGVYTRNHRIYNLTGFLLYTNRKNTTINPFQQINDSFLYKINSTWRGVFEIRTTIAPCSAPNVCTISSFFNVSQGLNLINTSVSPTSVVAGQRITFISAFNSPDFTTNYGRYYRVYFPNGTQAYAHLRNDTVNGGETKTDIFNYNTSTWAGRMELRTTLSPCYSPNTCTINSVFFTVNSTRPLAIDSVICNGRGYAGVPCPYNISIYAGDRINFTVLAHDNGIDSLNLSMTTNGMPLESLCVPDGNFIQCTFFWNTNSSAVNNTYVINVTATDLSNPSATQLFTTTLKSPAPLGLVVPSLTLPAANANLSVYNGIPTDISFNWRGINAGPGVIFTVVLLGGSGNIFATQSFIETMSSNTTTIHQLTMSYTLDSARTYYWKVTAVDPYGQQLTSINRKFYTYFNQSNSTIQKINITNFGSYRAWSDGTFAKSCFGYRYPSNTRYSFEGDNQSGTYMIDVDGNGNMDSFSVYCDMISEGGGWTYIMYTNGNQTDMFIYDNPYPSSTFACGSGYTTCTLGYTKTFALLNLTSDMMIRAEAQGTSSLCKFYFKKTNPASRWGNFKEREMLNGTEYNYSVGWMMRDFYTALNSDFSDVDPATYNDLKSGSVGSTSSPRYAPWAWPDDVQGLSSGRNLTGMDKGFMCNNHGWSPGFLAVKEIPVNVINDVDSVDVGIANGDLIASSEGVTSSKVVYNWKRNDIPFARLIVPFEEGSNPGIVRDYSGYGYNGLAYAPEWQETNGFDGGGVYSFDKADDYIAFGNIGLSRKNQTTIMAWINTNSLVNGTPIFKRSAQLYFGMGSSACGGGDHLQLTIGTINACTNHSVLSIGEWQHVAVVYDGSANNTKRARFFVNGFEVTNSVQIGTIPTTIPAWLTSEDYLLGKSIVSGLVFDGRIDDFMIFNDALTPAQIAVLAAGNTNRIVYDQTKIGDIWQACVSSSMPSAKIVETCSDPIMIY